jgi:hypothetical protein
MGNAPAAGFNVLPLNSLAEYLDRVRATQVKGVLAVLPVEDIGCLIKLPE